VSKTPIRILIADDHPVFRFGLQALLESQPDMVVVGEAESGEEVVTKARALLPDVVLMDVNMPDLNGIDATRRITALSANIAVLIITMFDDETVLTAMQAGASGYVLKGAQGLETLRAVRAVANGDMILSSGVAKQIPYFSSRGTQKQNLEPFPELTPREREVLELLAQGLTNQAIAEKLVLSPKTIRNQTSIIFGKLQVASRNEAIVKAREAGMGSR
jgi:DNA-binding NarL/FixJ family response regulator